MPRMPRNPVHEVNCICNCVSSSSGADVKIKLLEEKLLKELENKQNKLTAGENITITDDNVISAQCHVTMGEDFLVTKDVGYLKKGDQISKDERPQDVLKRLLNSIEPEKKSIFVYVGSEDAGTIDDGWTEIETTAEVVDEGFSHLFESDTKHYVAIAYTADWGDLTHIYQNKLYDFDLLEMFEKESVTSDIGTYFYYRCHEKMSAGSDTFEFLWTK